MRCLPCLLLALGCSAPVVTPPPYGLSLAVALGSALPGDNALTVATVRLHLTRVTALSDRGAGDPRARLDAVDLDPGASSERTLPLAPPGLYSGVELTLGDSATAGLDLQGAWRQTRLHVALTGPTFSVFCDAPQSLERGMRARLSLAVDMTRWLDGVDLTQATVDVDDQGLLISFEDNAPLATAVLHNATNSFQLTCEPW